MGNPGRSGVRVVAGRYRGLRLLTLPGVAVRPTSDRVKEALFSILGNRVEGSVLVDCFAGTGALGIEALSRGANRVFFVEKDASSISILARNLDRLNSSGGRIVRADALEPRTWGDDVLPANLILADPPYRHRLGDAFLTALAETEALLPDGSLVLEHETGGDPEHPDWILSERREYGDTTLSFFETGRRSQ